nr:platelet endothelial aggregation receptor 1-like [Biomphalaria glabrata]
MTMPRSFVMLQFIISLCVKVSKTDSLSQFGLQFAFAIPKVNTMDVSVAIVTVGTSSFTVTLYTSVPGSTDKSSIETFSVSADVSVDYMLDKGLLSESGRHHCLLLEAELEFAVFVHLSEAENSTASLMLLPIKTWGRRYYLATLSTRAFAVIVAEEETIVKLRFKMEPPSAVTLTLNGAYYTDRSTLKLLLQMYEAFTVSRCDSQYKSEILSLTGSVVESLKPVGVISGSCSSYMRISSRYVQHYMPKEVEICTSYSSPITHDIAADMPLPQYMFGQRYDTPAILGRASHEMFFFVATSSGTNIFLPMNHQSVKEYKLKYPEDVRVAPLNFSQYERGPRRVVATKTFSAALVLTSTCGGAVEQGGPSIVSILHADIFHKVYVWRLPPFANMDHYVIIICERSTVITINGKDPNFSIQDIFSTEYSPYVQKEVMLTDAHVVVSSDSVFGCYFYGLGQSSYVTIGGLEYRDERKLECVHTKAKANDKVDNDCDGSVDEESVNGKDDDKDNMCDEDFASEEGDAVSYNWGPRCLLNCSGCVDGCSSIDGLCDQCKTGYETEFTGCDKFVCEPYRYGLRCEGDCIEKCGEDCENHRIGTCPEHAEEERSLWARVWDILYISLIILAALLVLILLLLLLSKLSRHCEKTVAPIKSLFHKKSQVRYPNPSIYIDGRSQAVGNEGKSPSLSGQGSSSSSSSSSDNVEEVGFGVDIDVTKKKLSLTFMKALEKPK